MLSGIDRLSYQSRWRDKDPVAKFLGWLVFIVLAMALPPVGQLIELALLASLTCWLLKVSLWRWLCWMSLPLSFLLVASLALALTVTREPAGVLWGMHLGGVTFGVSQPGLVLAWNSGCRSLAALAATFWFVLNLPFPQLIQLLKRCRVPALLTEQVLLTWRFIFILLDEAAAIYRAQTLRFGYRNVPCGYRSLAMLISLLFSRVMWRYQQMTTALDMKLYQGDFHL